MLGVGVAEEGQLVLVEDEVRVEFADITLFVEVDNERPSTSETQLS